MSLKMIWRRSTGGTKKINTVFYESFAIATNAPKAKRYNEQSDYGPLSKEIVQFMSWVADEGAEKDHIWTFNYIPQKGTEVYVDRGKGNILKGVIPGLEFKKTLFKIWIGEKQAVGKSCKNGMLGK